VRRPSVRRSPSTLVSRQAAIRIDLALEVRHECSASVLGQTPGIMRRMQ
jgi:hypothetical protein